MEPRREHSAPKSGSRIWPNRKRRRTLARIRFWVRWAISTVSAYRPVIHFLELLASLRRVSPMFRARQTAVQEWEKKMSCAGMNSRCVFATVPLWPILNTSTVVPIRDVVIKRNPYEEMEGKRGVILRATDISYSVDKRGALRVFLPGKNDIFPFCEARCGAWLESSCPVYSILNRININSLRPEFFLYYFYPTSDADKKMWMNNQGRFSVNFFLNFFELRPFFTFCRVNWSF